MERGFKTWCENSSLQVRQVLGLADVDPLPYAQFATFLNVQLWTPEEVRGLSEQAKRTLRREGNYWSAITVSYAQRDAVIINPSHVGGRRSSDVMHELSHLFIGHKPATVILTPDKTLALRSFNRDQEGEANWLAWCLLLPRPTVMHIVTTAMAFREACQHYGVSGDVLRFRTNVTGAAAQLQRRRLSVGRNLTGGQS